MLRWLARSRLRTALAILFFGITFLLSVALSFLHNETFGNTSDLIPLAGVITAIGSVIGTISTVVLAWRTDRRTAKEAELKLVQMQQQIKELEIKLATAQVPPRILEK